MVNFFPDDSVIHISNGIIDEITRDNNNTLVTISYTDRVNNRRREQTVRLVVGRHTTILDENGNIVPVRTLTVGMTVNASFSSAMTRSIPPQATAFLIRILRRPASEQSVTGVILEIDRRNRNFTTISDGNRTSIIRFNVPMNTPIFDRAGRPMDFSRLMQGMRVRVRHAAFMTASIPPQTTAFEIRVL
ncbi:MAG: hypothetical protein IJ439_07820 [Tyzzerella sp.]|nr:hypothetical protein [Tyzzerella sp.]